jgi:cytochrome c-type biogenesis protein CcmH/NrfF
MFRLAKLSLSNAVRLQAVFRQRALQSIVLGALTLVMLGAGPSRESKLGHAMICTCGCNQILMECNHVGCPVSPVMIGELQDRIAEGGTDTVVLNWFAAKYGAIVLASPIRGGFDDVAWIMPISVFVLATLGTGAVVWMWRRRTLRLLPAAGSFDPGAVGYGIPAANGEDPSTAAMRERIRRETEYR